MRLLKDVAARTGLRHTRPGEGCLENLTMFEAFEWYTPDDGCHWKRLQRAIPELKAIGIDNIWVPPGCKAGWKASNGYDIYDLYDLGEFDQKGSRRTKWGTKEDLDKMMAIASAANVGIYWDGILNHKAAADYTEKCHAVEVAKEDRTREVGEVREVEVWTGYSFPGREDRYSSFKHQWYHFTGTDYDARLKSADAIYRFVGAGKPGWAQDVDDENGNADYLMFNDLDFSQKEVRDDFLHWGEWISRDLGLSGFRLDAVKHISSAFLKSWMTSLDQRLGKRLFMVGEYFKGDVAALGRMIDQLEGRMHLFDVPLIGNFSTLSRDPDADMRDILKGSLVATYPHNTVTFVVNHDTQERHEPDHEVVLIEPWFLPLAYAFILLRADSGYPCVFYGDLYGIQGYKPRLPTCYGRLPTLILARKLYAYGKQESYFDDARCIGFTRSGHPSRSQGAGLAVVMNNALSYRFKRMCVGQQHAGEEWTDILKFAWGRVVVDSKGWAEFPVGPRSVGVWMFNEAAGRHAIDKLQFNDEIYKRTPGPIIVSPSTSLHPAAQ